jgi:hypothetical protein
MIMVGTLDESHYLRQVSARNKTNADIRNRCSGNFGHRFSTCHVKHYQRKIPPIGIETLGGRALQGLVTPLEIDVPYLLRRRAAKPARASKESVAVVGSGTTLN